MNDVFLYGYWVEQIKPGWGSDSRLGIQQIFVYPYLPLAIANGGWPSSWLADQQEFLAGWISLIAILLIVLRHRIPNWSSGAGELAEGMLRLVLGLGSSFLLYARAVRRRSRIDAISAGSSCFWIDCPC